MSRLVSAGPQGLPRRGRETAYRWAVASRVLAAIFGGYLLTSLITALLGFLLPGPRAEAVLTATMLGFAFYAGIVVWVFSASTATRAWRGLLAAIGLSGAALLLAQRLLA